MTRRLLLAGAALAAVAALPGRPVAAFAESELVILSEGRRHRFQVELARTPDERSRGLMFRRELAADRGMLFDFGRDAPVAMWMKNTYLPLDMLFIDANGRITRIAADTVPHSEAVIASGGPVRAVLEVPAGTAARLDITAGDRVLHPMFGG